MTKIVRIIARLNIGGPAFHVWILSERLASQGFHTILVTGQSGPGEKNYDEENELRPKNFRLVRLKNMGRSVKFIADLVSFFEIWWLLVRERPEIVHTHTAKAGVLGRVAAALAGVPIVVHTFHGHVFSGYFSPAVSRLIQWLERFLALFTDVIITLSPKLKQQIGEVYRVAPEKKIRVVPLGTEVRRLQDTPRRKGRIRSELKLGSDVFLLGSIGRLVPIKNIELLIEALAAVKGNWHLAIAGEGVSRPAIESSVARWGLQEKISFLGWCTKPEELLSDFDLFVLPSLNEGTPLAVIESFAAGCPVVATRVGGVGDLFHPAPALSGPEGVEAMEEGALVASGDAAAFSRAISWLMNNRALLVSAGERARKSADAFSVENLETRVADLYRELLEEKK